MANSHIMAQSRVNYPCSLSSIDSCATDCSPVSRRSMVDDKRWQIQHTHTHRFGVEIKMLKLQKTGF